MVDEKLFQVGVIIGTHGLRGDLKVRTETSGSQLLLDTDNVVLQCSDGKQLTLDIVKAAVHKNRILLKLKGYDHINQVDNLLNAKLLLPLDQFPVLDSGDYYWHQLEGITVVDQVAGELGVLSALQETNGHDLYVVQGSHGEIIFPAVDAFIDEIDIEHGQMKVTLPDGLIDLNR